MSEVIPEPEEDLIGATSQDVVAEEETSEKKKRGFTLFDGMLIASLLMITIATFMMVSILREYNGSWPFGGGAPWNP